MESPLQREGRKAFQLVNAPQSRLGKAGLTLLSPEASYRSLPKDKDSIRLLRIFPSLEFSASVGCVLYTTLLSKQPHYTALSYCWEDAAPTATITLDGVEKRVPGNLQSALRHLRDEQVAKIYWIDYLCINQSDISERAAQVSFMHDIFRNAQIVEVWLGPAADDSDFAMSKIRDWGQVLNDIDIVDVRSFFEKERWLHKHSANLYTVVSRIYQPYNARAWAAIGKLSERPWWERVWVVQEMAVARAVTVICGHRRLPWSHFIFADFVGSSNLLLLLAKKYSDSCQKMREIFPIARMNAFVSLGTSWSNLARKGSTPLLLSCLESGRYLKVTDPRDRIYGLLGLDDDNLAAMLVPSYSKSVSQVYVDFARTILSKGELVPRLSILSFAGMAVLGEGNPMNLPSWVPNWNNCYSRSGPFGDAIFEASRGFMDASPVHVTEEELILSGVLCDTVRKSIPASIPYPHAVSTCWLALGLNNQSAHPTGVPLLQVLFRTFAIDYDRVRRGRRRIRTDSCDEPMAPQHIQEEYLYSMVAAFLDQCIDGCSQVNDPILTKTESDSLYFQYRKRIAQLKDLPSELGFGSFFDPLAGEDALRWPDGKDFEFEITEGKPVYTSSLIQWTAGRNLFVTGQGYIGLGPLEVRSGDIICVPHGSEYPIVLRPEEYHYLLVGNAHVYGLMEGEAIEEVQKGRDRKSVV